MITVNIGEIKANPKNPRTIKDEKYKKLVQSIKDFPDMLNKRPLVCFTDKDGKYVVLGGNMRLKACQELKYKELPIILADEWTEEQKAEFLIKDNVGYGDWDWDELANDWDSEKLNEWGLDTPDEWEVKDLGTNFSLPDGEKEPFQQITFTLADDQANIIKKMIDEAKKEEGYKYCETFGNENSNGNALYYLIRKLYGES